MAKPTAESEEVAGKYPILRPEQGVSIRFNSKPELKKWVQGELDYWTTNIQKFNQLFVVTKTGNPEVGQYYQTYWQTKLNQLEPLRSHPDLIAFSEEISGDAEDYGLLFSSSPILGQATQFVEQGDVQSATLSVCVHTKKHLVQNPNGQREVMLVRYLTTRNIHSTGFKHGLTAQILMNEVTRMHEENNEFLEKSQKLNIANEQEFERVRKLYHTQLELDAPATYWITMKRWAVGQWVILLIIFVALIVTPFGIIWLNWNEFDTWLKQLIEASGSSFSLTALVVITIPVVAYGWVLKHISRLFVRALENSTDAKFRSMFATTFLSLADKTKSITQDDKAIVLNALFRPPTNASKDDGPPVGVVEFLKRSNE